MATRKTTKTVKGKVAVIYNDKGQYEAAGGWVKGNHPTARNLISEAKNRAWNDDDLSLTCIVDIELPIPQPPVGKVLKVKAVKP